MGLSMVEYNDSYLTHATKCWQRGVNHGCILYISCETSIVDLRLSESYFYHNKKRYFLQVSQSSAKEGATETVGDDPELNNVPQVRMDQFFK